MKSSRQRFADFRSKMKRGLLDLASLKTPGSDDPPNIGGHHRGPMGGGKHDFKLKKITLLAEYRILLQGYYGWLAGLIAIVLLNAATSMLLPYIMKLTIDYVFQNRPLPFVAYFPEGSPLHRFMPAAGMPSLNFLVLFLLAVTLVGVGLEWIRMLSAQQINFRLAGTLRQRLHDHLAKLSLAKLSDYKTGGIVSRIMGDVDGIVGGIQNAFLGPISACFRIACTLAILLGNDWRLCAVAAAFVPPVIAVHFLLFRRLRPMWRNIQDDRSTISGRLTDMFAGIRVVRSFRRERSEAKEFGAAQHTMIRKQRFTAILQRLLGTGWAVFVPAIGVVVIWYGGRRVLAGTLHIGDLVMFQAYILMLLGPITSMIESMQNLQQNLASMDRMIDVLHQPIEMPDSPNAINVPSLNSQFPIPNSSPTSLDLELRNVSFGYTPEKLVLHNLSLNIPAGSTLAIVGPSGSGKTTLVNLVARFFDVTAGAILLDGADIRSFRRDSYRALFAMVLQDVYLFDGTVADNIAYGKRHATRAEIIQAAQQANAHDFILDMEKTYDTVIGERGNRLSGGQKQRLSIARAILANPKILILDEATSSLDSKSESLIQNSLRDLMAQRTTLVIAHRLSTIMHADAIAVLEEGQIVELGSHDELMSKGGTYHSMFTQQFQKHRDPTLERMEWERS
jgi:ATP-binding cassette, subfamily B, bacterial